ncbi:MFS transporter [Neobacillus vireti]|uniref:MFS transporter n=1 Tax=Neobacillus vireti TaxID=220686 RepID=UPI002FFE3999
MNKEMTKQRSPWVPFLSLLFAAFVVVEAMAFQMPVLPVITREFGIPVALSGLIALCYYLAHTVFGPVFGHIADQIGRKKIVLIGFSIFAFAEFMAALSPNFGFFLFARFIQGVGAACIIPAALSYASYLFPAQKRGTAFGVYSGISALGAAAGGIFGGMLVGNLGWHSVYYFTGTISIIGLILVWATLPETESKERTPFDFIGSLLLLTSIGSLLSVTLLIANVGLTSPLTIGVFALGILLAILFWFYESKTKHPFLDVSFLKNRKFIVPLLIVFMLSIYFQGIIYSTVFFTTLKPGGGPEITGMLTSFIYLSSTLAGFIGGKIIDTFRIKRVIVTCVIGYIFGLIMFSQFSINTAFWYITLTISIMALTNGIIVVAAMKMAMTTVPEEKLGSGSGTFIMIRDIGTPTGQTAGLSLFGAISASSLSLAIADQSKNAGIDERFLPAIQDAAVTSGKTVDPSLTEHLNQLGIKFMDIFNSAQLDGMILALNKMGIIVLVLAAIPLILTFFLPNLPNEKANKTKEEIIPQDMSGSPLNTSK